MGLAVARVGVCESALLHSYSLMYWHELCGNASTCFDKCAACFFAYLPVSSTFASHLCSAHVRAGRVSTRGLLHQLMGQQHGACAFAAAQGRERLGVHVLCTRLAMPGNICHDTPADSDPGLYTGPL